jgi:hypothetical protein
MAIYISSIEVALRRLACGTFDAILPEQAKYRQKKVSHKVGHKNANRASFLSTN